MEAAGGGGAAEDAAEDGEAGVRGVRVRTHPRPTTSLFEKKGGGGGRNQKKEIEKHQIYIIRPFVLAMKPRVDRVWGWGSMWKNQLSEESISKLKAKLPLGCHFGVSFDDQIIKKNGKIKKLSGARGDRERQANRKIRERNSVPRIETIHRFFVGTHCSPSSTSSL